MDLLEEKLEFLLEKSLERTKKLVSEANHGLEARLSKVEKALVIQKAEGNVAQDSDGIYEQILSEVDNLHLV